MRRIDAVNKLINVVSIVSSIRITVSRNYWQRNIRVRLTIARELVPPFLG